MSEIFRGTYEHVLDKKGRVSVPKAFRQGLFSKPDDEVVVTFGLSKQLFVFSKRGWNALANGYAAMPDGDADLLDRFFGASARDCQLDAQGRILIAANLKAYANLEKEVCWVGQRGRVELWSKKQWELAQEAVLRGEFLTTSENLMRAYSRIDLQIVSRKTTDVVDDHR